METADLRPLSLGELLDRAFTLYRRNFWLFVGIMAIPSVSTVPFSPLFYSVQGPTATRGSGAPNFPAGYVLLIVAFVLFFWIVYALAFSAATYAVSETYLGHRVTIRESYGRIRGKLFKILGIMLLTFLRCIGMLLLVSIGIGILVVGSLALMGLLAKGQPQAVLGIIAGFLMVVAYVGGIGFWTLWALRYAVSIPAMLLENVGVREAIRRSIKLTKGRHWQLFAAFILSAIISYVGVIVFQGPFLVAIMATARAGRPPEWLSFTSSISGAIGGALTGPILMIVLVLCYYDTRIRKEAFDLQFMMSSLDGPAPSPEPIPPA
jgi:hypothetical protein